MRCHPEHGRARTLPPRPPPPPPVFILFAMGPRMVCYAFNFLFQLNHLYPSFDHTM